MSPNMLNPQNIPPDRPTTRLVDGIVDTPYFELVSPTKATLGKRSATEVEMLQHEHIDNTPHTPTPNRTAKRGKIGDPIATPEGATSPTGDVFEGIHISRNTIPFHRTKPHTFNPASRTANMLALRGALFDGTQLVKEESMHSEWPEEVQQMALAIAVKVAGDKLEQFIQNSQNTEKTRQKEKEQSELQLKDLYREVKSIKAMLITQAADTERMPITKENPRNSKGPKSVNATGPVIIPTRKTTNPTTHKNLPNPIARYDKHKLIVVREGSSLTGDSSSFNPRDTVLAINAKLASSEKSEHLRLISARQNGKGNLILTTHHTHTAGDLMPFKTIIEEELAGGGQARAQADRPYYGIQVNGVMTGIREPGTRLFTPEELQQELLEVNGHLIDPAKVVAAPRWMRRSSDLERENIDFSSFTMFFSEEEDARKLVRERYVHLFGYECRVRTFNPLPLTATQCQRCWRIGHRAERCPNQPACRLCGMEGHSEDKHATDMDTSPNNAHTNFTIQCAVCKGPHTANSRDCPERTRQRGDSEATVGTSHKRKETKSTGKTGEDGFTLVPKGRGDTGGHKTTPDITHSASTNSTNENRFLLLDDGRYTHTTSEGTKETQTTQAIAQSLNEE